MALEIWRVTHRNYLEGALTGEGARLYGGRFNSPGSPLVYASDTLSLAVLELLVQANSRSRLAGMVGVPLFIPDDIRITAARLPEGWDAIPYTQCSVEEGDRWIKSLKSPVLKVPSVVIPSECNYLVNPLHPDFQRIKVGEYRTEVVDPRLTG